MTSASPHGSAFPHGNGSPLSRRGWLSTAAGGLGGMALSSLLAGEASPAEGTHPALVFPVKAKRVVQLFMAGAASHIDLWDHNP